MPQPTSNSGGAAAAAYDAAIADQFTRQAVQFAAAPALHNQAALDLLVEAARPVPEDVSLDVACGPGSVVIAFAQRLRRAVGLDATEAMLDQARQLAARGAVENAEWHRGDVYALPFGASAFDIVSCRFAFHHFEEPARAFAEMVRVARPGDTVRLVRARLARLERVRHALKLAHARNSELRELPASVRTDFDQAGYLRPAQGVVRPRCSAGVVGTGLAHNATSCRRDRPRPHAWVADLSAELLPSSIGKVTSCG